ncbi:MAG: sulfite exporter TauE/SafE family protein [Candidatus Zixiibacteriota bacterium]|nr:MAG: sulfite exporter TauE/SafE family protein [candidate division Zixibacteria bacterium]
MSESSILILLGSALSIGFIHTVIGPDHYVPFIVISRARSWSATRTIVVTIMCGVGHVLSSILIGTIGIAAGSALGKLVAIESVRGDIASYALIFFGIIYGLWGIWRGRKGHGHKHLHGGRHLDASNARSITFWTLFIIFVLGPCEPLIPLLMFPAVSHSWYALTLVASVFGITTILTMTGMVYAGVKGVTAIKTDFIEKYVHAIAGGIIAFSGMAIRIFGI